MIRATCGFLLGLTVSASFPLHAAPPIEAYGRLRAVDDVRLSPSGDKIAYIATEGEQSRVSVTSPDGTMTKSIDVGRIKVRDLEWAGDDHLLIVLSATLLTGRGLSNQEMSTIDVVDLRAGRTFQVFREYTDRMAGGVHGYFGARQIDGHWYGWFGGQGCDTSRGSGCVTYHDYLDLYRVDLDSGSIQIAAQGHKDSRGWLISDRGEVTARSFYSQDYQKWQVAAGSEGDILLAAGENALGGAGALNYGRSADTILVATPIDGGEDAYSYRELSLKGAPEKGLTDGARIARALIDPTSHLWIGSTLQNDDLETVFFSPALQARWRGTQKAFPNYIPRLVSWNADFTRLIVLTEDGNDSGTYWLVDIQKHSADPIGSAYPDVKPADVGPASIVTWKASDGLDLHGVLTLPPGGKPAKALPLVVLPHDGPEARSYAIFEWSAQVFASRGYAVFQPNYRGSWGYGVEFRNAGFGQWGRKMQTDISDGVADLAAKGIVDPKRVCVVGGTYGGYAALAGVTVQRGLYRCAVSLAGVADPADMLTKISTNDGYRSAATRYWQTFMGVTQWQGGQLDPLSPIALAANADAPILLIHAKDDSVVPYSQSVSMERALKSAGKPVEFVTMDNEDHWLSREATRTQMLKAAVAFVEKYNPAN